jgi:hypothetical protein
MDTYTAEDIKIKQDELISAVNDLELLVAAHMDGFTEFANCIENSFEYILREELKKAVAELTKSFRKIVADALTPHRRLVPAKEPRIPESAVDFTDEEEDEDEESSDSDSIRPAQRCSKLARYTEH